MTLTMLIPFPGRYACVCLFGLTCPHSLLELVTRLFGHSTASFLFPLAGFVFVALDKVIKRVYSQTSKFCLIISYGGRGSRSNDEWASMDANTISASTSLSKKSELELPLDNCPVQIECVVLVMLFECRRR